VETNLTEAIIRIMNDVARDDCADVGPTYVKLVAEGNVEFIRPKEGSYLDLTTALAVLAAIASSAKSGLEIYFLLKEKLGRKPTEKEVAEELRKKAEQKPENIKQETIEEVAKSICNIELEDK
jgi:hypothetical protein